MSAKASSDFGLYKEKQKENSLKYFKLVVIITAVILLLVGLYILVQLTHNTPHLDGSFEATIEKPTANAEKLILSESIKREEFQNLPPKPFGVTYRGHPPSEFTSTTEKATTLNYPQLNNYYRHKYYPKNIQDVIGYANTYRPTEINPDFTIKYNKNYKQSPSQYVLQNRQSAKNFSLGENDPFYSYKPQDPGDINLLATASLRFAPPPWTNLKTTFPKLHPIQQQYQDNTNRKEIYNPAKPLTVTLNIYPNNENEVYGEHRYGLKHFFNQRLENFQSRLRFPEHKPKKMVIHLNLYPDGISGGESNVYKNVLTTPLTT